MAVAMAVLLGAVVTVIVGFGRPRERSPCELLLEIVIICRGRIC